MSKIAIVSNAEEGVVIDISGCDSPAEAKHYLTSTLQVSSRFWEGLTVDLNLGRLPLTPQQVSEILSIVREVGVDPSRVVSSNVTTVASLYEVTKKEPVPAEGGDMAVLASEATDAVIAFGALTGNCCSELPALSVEGNGTTTVSVNADCADVSVTTSVAVNALPPLAQGSPSTEAGAEAFAGNRTTQDFLSMFSEEPPVVLEALRVSDKTEAGMDSVTSPVTVSASCSSTRELSPVVVPGSGAGSVVQSGPTAVIVAIPLSPSLPLPGSRESLAASGTTSLKSSQTKSSPRNANERAGVLYLRQTLRSGQAVSHKGDLVIIGDVNPGAEVSAEGDITVWGALRGVAHAGTAGNASAEIRALKFDPIQLRIAHAIARAPDRSKTASLGPTGPETARIYEGKIRISASDPD